MGTTIRRTSKKDLLNNGDLFSLTQPAMIGDIHRRFLEAGADIIETNTFSRHEHRPERVLRRRPAREGRAQRPGVLPEDHRRQVPQRPRLGDQFPRRSSAGSGPTDRQQDGRKRFVAGAIGPLTVSLSNFPDADDAGFRVRHLRPGEGGLRAARCARSSPAASILLLVETIFDSLNAKAALVAIEEVFAEDKSSCPS
jgi:5-methyltetrahydrofolate--homocysteine methyltransferase